MEPIPFFYDSINRNAIVIRPKKPFFEWIQSVYPKDKPITEKENTIYLIREGDTNDIILKWLKKNFDGIFANELNDWCTDEKSWPKNRTSKMFDDWFTVEICSMVLDLEDFPVEKDC